MLYNRWAVFVVQPKPKLYSVSQKIPPAVF